LSKTTENICLIYDPVILLSQIPSSHNHSFLYKIVFLDDLHLKYRLTNYPRVIRSKTYRGYVKPRIKPNAIYNVIFE